jgi:dTDP-4-dehydrorhamnose reductase
MKQQPHIAVVGGTGQLGQALQQHLSVHLQPHAPQWIFYPRELFDLEDLQQIPVPLRDHRPDVLLNLAAYTDVDGAEQDADRAFQVNAVGPGLLAGYCQSIGCTMVHISTDYVYGGSGNRPFRESDPLHPQGVYARSKEAGEKAILTANPGAVIIRTSWLYSLGSRKNFLTTMQRLGVEHSEINVVNDQIGTPTWAGDLAKALHRIIHQILEEPQTDFAGIYNFSNEGTASWYDFAWSIMDLGKIDCTVRPVSTSAFPRPAPRPAFSLMNKEKIRQTFGLDIAHWQDGLRRCLNEQF